jgi:hypothetical protein
MRTLVALLLLANLGFFALARGWLQPYVGLAAQHEREPQRLAGQLNADSVRVLAQAPAAVPSAPVCIQAGPFSGEQLDAIEASLEAAPLSAATWRRLPADAQADWRLLLGGFADSAALARQQELLREQGVDTEVVGAADSPAAALLLGRYPDREAAEAALLQWQQRGLAPANVAPPLATLHWMRVEQPDEALRQQLQALAAATPGSSVVACPAPR